MDNSIISTLGGGSGINTTNLVNQLVEIEKAPQQNRIDSQKEKLEAQISAYGTLKSSLSTFQGLLTPLTDNDTFNSRSASIPDTTVITANSLDANAQPGTYQIEVEAIAQQHSLAANATYADKRCCSRILVVRLKLNWVPGPMMVVITQPNFRLKMKLRLL